MYFEKTIELGEWLGKQGKTLIYGGANLGLMDCIARTVKAYGGTVVGVVPSKLEENGKVQSQWQYFENVQHKRRRAYKKRL